MVRQEGRGLKPDSSHLRIHSIAAEADGSFYLDGLNFYFLECAFDLLPFPREMPHFSKLHDFESILHLILLRLWK